MKKEKYTRPLALLLSAALLIGQLGVTAYADGDNLCEHHTSHDAAVCGFSETDSGTPCGYVCGECGDKEPDKDSGTEELPKNSVKVGGLTALTNSFYDSGDVEAFQVLLTAHPSLVSGIVERDDPESWQTAGLVSWDGSTKKLIEIYLSGKNLTGTLDVSGFSNLQTLRCYNNPGLTGLTLGQHDALTRLYCYETGISGTLDVSGFRALETLWCYNNPGLTGLTLGEQDALTDLRCYNTGLSGTLDVSGCSALQTLRCYENPKLTGLTLGEHKALTSLRCYNTGLSQPLDLSRFTKLEDLAYDSKAVTLPGGRINAKDGGKIQVQFGPVPKDDNDEILIRVPFTLTALPDSGYQFNGWTGLPDGIDRNAAKVSFTPGTGYTYTASFTREASTDSTLKSLSLSSGTLTPAFDPATTSYTATVGHDVESVTVTARANNSKAGVTVIGVKPLKMGENKFIIIVTAKSGDKKEYTVTITREGNNDAALRSLSLSAGTLTPAFDPAKTAYTATVGYSVESVTVTAGANDANATVTGDGAKNLKVGENEFTITATAENGTTQKNYTVTITRQAANNDAALKTLSLSAGTLTPAFDPAKTAYTATVGYSVESVTITAGANDANATVTGDGAKNLKVGENECTITVTAGDGTTQKNYTVTITRQAASSGGGGGGGDDAIATPQQPAANHPIASVVELPVTVENGVATGTASDERTASAIAGAQKDPLAKTNGIALRYDASAAGTYNGFSIIISRATLNRLTTSRVKALILNTGIVDLTFDLAALREIAAKSTDDITLTATRETGLTGDALAAVGSRPAYRLSVNYTGRDGKVGAVQSFGAGRAIVGLAYQPTAAEQSGRLFLVHSADGKAAQWLSQSNYDRTSGNVLASTGHFSVFGVGYRSAPAFADTASHWAKNDIDFAVSRGLLTSATATTFAPNGAVSRGTFVAALGRLAGVDETSYKTSRFTDVKADAYYAPYVNWAASKGIVSGTTATTFSPDAAITREQLAVMMANYAKAMGYTLPRTREAAVFVDAAGITATAKDAVTAMQMAGIMSGKGTNCFDPKGTVTRAEAAAALRRLVETVVSPTATGWSQNDAGKWLYYENGKPVTGWKQIQSKWYYFLSDGSMAVNAKVGSYLVGSDGARIG